MKNVFWTCTQGHLTDMDIHSVHSETDNTGYFESPIQFADDVGVSSSLTNLHTIPQVSGTAHFTAIVSYAELDINEKGSVPYSDGSEVDNIDGNDHNGHNGHSDHNIWEHSCVQETS